MSRALLALFIFIISVSLGLFLIFYFRDDAPAPINVLTEKISEEVSFSAPDGYVLEGTLWNPRPFSNQPTLILIHDYGKDRHEFDPVISKIQERGFGILAYDIRGFGESQGITSNVQEYPDDVYGAVRYIQSNPVLSANGIGIIGNVLGGHLAFTASRTISTVRAIAVFGPSELSFGAVLHVNIIPRFRPHTIFIVAAKEDHKIADQMFAEAIEPRELNILSDDRESESLFLDENLLDQALVFFQRYLERE